MTDPLDDLELWKKHTDSDANAEKALGRYMEWKDPDGFKELDFGGCGLTSLPPEIGSLTSLTDLWCRNNQLTTLPPEIGGLASLRFLQCDNNQLTTLPPEIGALTSLEQLFCNNNQFAEGEPRTIEELRERWCT